MSIHPLSLYVVSGLAGILLGLSPDFDQDRHSA